jgi:Flp pilus assembly protein TadG
MKMPNDMHKRVIALICAFDSMMPVSKASSRPAGTRFHSRLRTDDEGSNLVEFALIMPMLLMFLTGIFSIGVAFSNQQALTQAVGIGAAQLSQSRNLTSNPCDATLAAIKAAAPQLTKKITLTLTLNGKSSCDATDLNATSATSVTVNATYDCPIQVYGMTVIAIPCNATVTEFEY